MTFRFKYPSRTPHAGPLGFKKLIAGTISGVNLLGGPRVLVTTYHRAYNPGKSAQVASFTLAHSQVGLYAQL